MEWEEIQMKVELERAEQKINERSVPTEQVIYRTQIKNNAGLA